MAIRYTSMDTPIGRLWLAATENGLCRIGLPNESQEFFFTWLAKVVVDDPPRREPDAFAGVAEQLDQYFAQMRKTFDVTLDLRGSPFRRSVWQAVAAIPYGTTVTYGAIALQIGRGLGSARAIGAANGANPLPIIIPCHRVIGADGSLTGFGGGLETKAALLQLEGIQISEMALRSRP